MQRKQKRQKQKPKPKPRAKRRRRLPKKTTAIVPVAAAPPVVINRVTIIPKVKAAIENLERVRRFVSQCLNVDLQVAERAAQAEGKVLDKDTRQRLEVDWGTIPGADKPFLMQPGAEKVLHWLQLRPKFITRELDLGQGHLEVVSHIVIYSKITGEEVFEGPDASCSTMETNYQYIWAQSDTMPSDEEKERLKAIKMGQMRKVFDWKKGQKVGERWAWFIRVPNPNIWNERNKVRQIGEKRGLVKGVKQMGALSSIFNADPSEWVFTTADEEETPENEMDYTEGGRLIVREDGRTPSGRMTPQAQAEAARKNQADIAKQKTQLAEDKPHGHQPGTEKAKQAESQLSKVEAADLAWKKEQERKKEESSKPPIDVKPVTPARDTSTGQPGGKTPAAKLTPQEKKAKEIQKATIIKGMVDDIREGKTSGNVPIVTVKMGHTSYTCFSKTVQPEIIAHAKGYFCEMFIDARHCIVGVKRLGTREYEDGYLPTVQRSEQEAGQRTLY